MTPSKSLPLMRSLPMFLLPLPSVLGSVSAAGSQTSQLRPSSQSQHLSTCPATQTSAYERPLAGSSSARDWNRLDNAV